LSVSRAAMEHGNSQATSVPQLEPPDDIRLEFGDFGLESKADVAVAPEVDLKPDGIFRWSEKEA